MVRIRLNASIIGVLLFSIAVRAGVFGAEPDAEFWQAGFAGHASSAFLFAVPDELLDGVRESGSAADGVLFERLLEGIASDDSGVELLSVESTTGKSGQLSRSTAGRVVAVPSEYSAAVASPTSFQWMLEGTRLQHSAVAGRIDITRRKRVGGGAEDDPFGRLPPREEGETEDKFVGVFDGSLDFAFSQPGRLREFAIDLDHLDNAVQQAEHRFDQVSTSVTFLHAQTRLVAVFKPMPASASDPRSRDKTRLLFWRMAFPNEPEHALPPKHVPPVFRVSGSVFPLGEAAAAALRMSVEEMGAQLALAQLFGERGTRPCASISVLANPGIPFRVAAFDQVSFPNRGYGGGANARKARPTRYRTAQVGVGLSGVIERTGAGGFAGFFKFANDSAYPHFPTLKEQLQHAAGDLMKAALKPEFREQNVDDITLFEFEGEATELIGEFADGDLTYFVFITVRDAR